MSIDAKTIFNPTELSEMQELIEINDRLKVLEERKKDIASNIKSAMIGKNISSNPIMFKYLLLNGYNFSDEQILNMEDVLYELFPTIDKNPYLEKNLNVRFAFNLIHLAPGIVTSGTQILKDLKKLLSGNK